MPNVHVKYLCAKSLERDPVNHEILTAVLLILALHFRTSQFHTGEAFIKF